MLLYGERHDGHFTQRFHWERFVNIANPIDLIAHRHNGDDKTFRATGRQNKDVVGDFSIVIIFVFPVGLFYQLGIVGCGLREYGCTERDVEREETHAKNCFIHYAFLLILLGKLSCRSDEAFTPPSGANTI